MAHDALAKVMLSDRSGSKIRELSGGMRRRVALAQAIASEPEVLLLDEPSTGLDPEQRHIMVSLIAQLGVTVVLSSHIIEDVSDIAHRVVILDTADVAFAGPLEKLKLLAPAGTPPAKAAEAGFLTVITSARHTTS
ncbi:MAG: ATP-binding cassette domain-containing protein [Angustibacter sp.]